jgi:hypothetical protein
MAGLTEFYCRPNETSHASQFKWLDNTFNKRLLWEDQGEFWEYKDDLSITSIKFSSSTAVVFHLGVAFGIGLCEIMGTVFACLLAKKFNSKFDRMV